MTASLSTWRISDAAALAGGDLATLATGLRHHLAVADLHSALVQIGDRQQAYVSLSGCPGCAAGRCVEGCRVDLLRRALRAAGGRAVALEPVAEGLNPLGYRSFLWAWPARRDATPLCGELLAGWQRARLVVHWHALPQRRLWASALLALGGEVDGPPLAPRLAEAGWSVQAVPSLLQWGAAEPRWLLAGLCGAVWSRSPWLALPVAQTVEVPA